MSEPLAGLARAATAEEVEAALAAVSSDRKALAHLERLAVDLFDNKYGLPAALALRVFGDAARRAGLEQEVLAADYSQAMLLSIAAFTDGDLPTLDEAIEKATMSVAKLGSLRDVVEARATGVRLLLESGDPARALRHAIAACESIERSSDLKSDVLFDLHMLGRLVYDHVVGRTAVDPAELFRREGAIMERAGERELTTCASARLCCAHVAAGRAERGQSTIEPLLDPLRKLRMLVGTSIETAGADDLREVDELFAALYWSARALEITGRVGSAERRYRDHPWIDAGNVPQRAEILIRLAVLLAAGERYQESLDVLQRLPSAVAESAPVHAAVAASLQAMIAAILETAEAAALVVVAENAVAMVAPTSRNTVIDRWHRGVSHLAKSDPPAPTDLLPLARLMLAQARLALDPAAAEAILEETDRDEGAPATVEALRRRVRGDALIVAGRLEDAQAELEASLAACLAIDASDQEPLPMIAERTRRESRLQHGVAAEVSLRLARVARLRGLDPQPHLDRALEIARQQNRLHLLFEALLERGDLEGAADAIEAIRADLRDLELQLGAMAGKDEVYAQLLDRAHASGDAEDALRILERCKARALLDVRSTRTAVSVDTASAGEAGVLRRRIVNEMRRQIAEGVSVEDRRRLVAWKTRLAAIQRRQVLATRVSARAPSTPAEVVALTDEKTALLHLFCHADGTHLVFARGGKAMPPRFIAAAGVRRIAALVETLRFEIATLSTARSLDELAMLIAPVAADLDGVERLLVLPHGPLHAVPFHALPFRGAPLLAQTVVCYSSSVAIAAACAAELRKAPRPSAAAVFGTAETPYLPLRRLPNAEMEIEEIAGIRRRRAAIRRGGGQPARVVRPARRARLPPSRLSRRIRRCRSARVASLSRDGAGLRLRALSAPGAPARRRP